MPETPEIVHDAVEGVKELEHEAEVGASARTPLLLVSGITLLVAVVLTVLMVVVFAAYYLSK